MGESSLRAHDFKERLDWSVRASHDTFWVAMYRKAFPDMLYCDLITDKDKQKAGIDRKIVLDSGLVLLVDEKKRSEVWPDILLEYESSPGRPGWIEKNLAIDYIAYAFMPTKKCFLYPWQMLRRAWLHYGDRWKAQYKHVPGKNPGYTTMSVAVPIGVLAGAVRNAAIIDVAQELRHWEYVEGSDSSSLDAA